MARTKIKLTRDTPEADRHKGFTAKRVVVKIGDHWIDAHWNTISSQTIDALTKEGVRFMVDCELHGSRVYIVTHEEDVAGLKTKYPECSIIYMSQIIGMLAGLPRKVDNFGYVPQMLIELGAEVIGHGKIKKDQQKEIWQGDC